MRSDLTGRLYHLVVTEDASLLGNPGAFLMERPQYCGRPRLSDPPNIQVPFLRPFWNADVAEFGSRGSTARDLNTVFFRFQDQDRLQGRFSTTNRNFIPVRSGPRFRPIGFQGERIQTEKDLVRLAGDSVINSPQADQASGVYQGNLADGSVITLSLNRNTDNRRSENWNASFELGQYVSMPMSSTASRAGLIRLVRVPATDPRWVSGLTGTVLRDSEGRLEFHGLWFVVRNGCITPIRLRKISD